MDREKDADKGNEVSRAVGCVLATVGLGRRKKEGRKEAWWKVLVLPLSPSLSLDTNHENSMDAAFAG